MSLTDFDTVALRIAQLVIDADRMNKPRETILAEIMDFGNELLDQRDNIISRMEKEFEYDRLHLSSL